VLVQQFVLLQHEKGKFGTHLDEREPVTHAVLSVNLSAGLYATEDARGLDSHEPVRARLQPGVATDRHSRFAQDLAIAVIEVEVHSLQLHDLFPLSSW